MYIHTYNYGKEIYLQIVAIVLPINVHVLNKSLQQPLASFHQPLLGLSTLKVIG